MWYTSVIKCKCWWHYFHQFMSVSSMILYDGAKCHLLFYLYTVLGLKTWKYLYKSWRCPQNSGRTEGRISKLRNKQKLIDRIIWELESWEDLNKVIMKRKNALNSKTVVSHIPVWIDGLWYIRILKLQLLEILLPQYVEQLSSFNNKTVCFTGS